MGYTPVVPSAVSATMLRNLFLCSCTSLPSPLPSPFTGSSLSFDFLNCPLCKERMCHPALSAALSYSLNLEEKVMVRAPPCVLGEEMHTDVFVRPCSSGVCLRWIFFGSATWHLECHRGPCMLWVQKLAQEGLKRGGWALDCSSVADVLSKHAFYQCIQCEKVFCGGLRACGNDVDQRPRLCSDCSNIKKCKIHGEDHMYEELFFSLSFCSSLAAVCFWRLVHPTNVSPHPSHQILSPSPRQFKCMFCCDNVASFFCFGLRLPLSSGFCYSRWGTDGSLDRGVATTITLTCVCYFLCVGGWVAGCGGLACLISVYIFRLSVCGWMACGGVAVCGITSGNSHFCEKCHRTPWKARPDRLNCRGQASKCPLGATHRMFLSCNATVLG